jgi:hypothetical protein
MGRRRLRPDPRLPLIVEPEHVREVLRLRYLGSPGLMGHRRQGITRLAATQTTCIAAGQRLKCGCRTSLSFLDRPAARACPGEHGERGGGITAAQKTEHSLVRGSGSSARRPSGAQIGGSLRGRIIIRSYSA